MRHRPPAAAPQLAEREELLREQDLLTDLLALLRACPEFPLSLVLDTALALHAEPRAGRAARTRR